MFELPEFVTLAKQLNATLCGKTVQRGVLGNSPHKFVWYNRSHDEFERLTRGKTLGQAHAKAKFLFLPLEPGYVLLLGDCGGKVLYHPSGTDAPQKYHLLLALNDGSHLSVTTQMWGAMELWRVGEEQQRQYIRDMRTTPIDPEFTLDYMSNLIDSLIPGNKLSVKGLLTLDQTIPGVGTALAQDILFRARLSPRHPITELSKAQRRKLHNAIVKTVREVIARGGRYDEFDLYGQPGKYIRLMDAKAMGRPCPECGGKIAKEQYLGGSCYYCPRCQQ